MRRAVSTPTRVLSSGPAARSTPSFTWSREPLASLGLETGGSHLLVPALDPAKRAATIRYRGLEQLRKDMEASEEATADGRKTCRRIATVATPSKPRNVNFRLRHNLMPWRPIATYLALAAVDGVGSGGCGLSHPADRQPKKIHNIYLAVGSLHRDGLLLMDIAIVFEWFARESEFAAQLPDQQPQREIWIRLAEMWASAAAQCCQASTGQAA
jgi:hypothetical protein